MLARLLNDLRAALTAGAENARRGAEPRNGADEAQASGRRGLICHGNAVAAALLPWTCYRCGKQREGSYVRMLILLLPLLAGCEAAIFASSVLPAASGVVATHRRQDVAPTYDCTPGAPSCVRLRRDQ
jgi:hypothetical protein